MATTTAVTAKANALTALSGILEKYRNQIAMALPRHMTPERMIRVALTAMSTTPALAECDPYTIAGAVVQSSILGLEPNSVLGEAYLVPFKNSKTQRKECQLIPGYLGLLKLVRQSGELVMVNANRFTKRTTSILRTGSIHTCATSARQALPSSAVQWSHIGRGQSSRAAASSSWS